jgi:hypothetical protein
MKKIKKIFLELSRLKMKTWRAVDAQNGGLEASVADLHLAAHYLRTASAVYGIALKGLSHETSVADPGCLSRIPDPTFFHELSPSRIPAGFGDLGIWGFGTLALASHWLEDCEN